MGLCDVGALGHIAAKAGINQNLPLDLRRALVARLQTQRCRQIAASTIARHHAWAKRLQHSPTLIESHRERIFWRETIFHRSHFK